MPNAAWNSAVYNRCPDCVRLGASLPPFRRVWTVNMNVEFISLVIRRSIDHTRRVPRSTVWQLPLYHHLFGPASVASGITRPWLSSISINSPSYITCVAAMQSLSPSTRILPCPPPYCPIPHRLGLTHLSPFPRHPYPRLHDTDRLLPVR